MSSHHEESLLFGSAAQRNNRLLLDDSHMDAEDQFLRRNKADSPLLGGARNLRRSPLIEEEGAGLIQEELLGQGAGGDDISFALGLPKLQAMRDEKKAASARGFFNMMKYQKNASNPWSKRHQQGEARVQNMFGQATPQAQGFAKLFGRNPGNFRQAEREDAKATRGGFFSRWKQTRQATSGRTWFEKLFGAKKKRPDLAPEEKAALKTRPGQSWADALAPIKADGSAKYSNWQDDEGSGSVAPDNQNAKASWQPVEDEPVAAAPAPAPPQVAQVPEYELPAQDEAANLYGDDAGTVDDNSIDLDNESEDDDDERDQKLKQPDFIAAYTQQLLQRYK